MTTYGDTKYWDDRYLKDTDEFEWYQGYDSLKSILSQYVKRDDHILIVGCGNSNITGDMYKDGYKYITNIDISSVCIQQMKTKYASTPEIQWDVMDVCHMTYSDESFDFIFDKGTMDAILCSDNDQEACSSALKEILRVLKPNGIYFNMTYGIPSNRMCYFNIPPFQVTHEQVLKPQLQNIPGSVDDAHRYHHMYICKKITSKE
ncbi:hypothetical protein WA158_005934 [Blastocystis sp. Blastoise]